MLFGGRSPAVFFSFCHRHISVAKQGRYSRNGFMYGGIDTLGWHGWGQGVGRSPQGEQTGPFAWWTLLCCKRSDVGGGLVKQIRGVGDRRQKDQIHRGALFATRPYFGGSQEKTSRFRCFAALARLRRTICGIRKAGGQNAFWEIVATRSIVRIKGAGGRHEACCFLSTKPLPWSMQATIWGRRTSIRCLRHGHHPFQRKGAAGTGKPVFALADASRGPKVLENTPRRSFLRDGVAATWGGPHPGPNLWIRPSEFMTRVSHAK